MNTGARIHGRAVPLDNAIAEAARLIAGSRCAVFAGLATDVAGGAAAVELARRVGGVIDHMHADAALRDLDLMRRAGWVVTTPAQARARADVLLLAGPGLDAAWPRLWDELQLDRAPSVFPETARRVVRLCVGRVAASSADAGASVLTIGEDAAELQPALGVLRALVAGRPVRSDAALLQPLRECASLLSSARFGVIVWSAEWLDALSIEMLCGLIDDLNAKTRFAGLPVAPGGNAMGVAQVGGWMTGFPLRIGFARNRPEHDPWRFDAARMIDSGEADLAVWISAFAPQTPPWRRAVPTVALVASGTKFRSPPEVEIGVGRPGVDHASVTFDFALGALVCKQVTTEQSPASRSVAEILHRIGGALHDVPPRPC
jgi:formylmethanofuran dehydrogenase subunit B